jgi:3-deoxy-manno-octulosonate cytidylyltransferase (CMP-KDO synthetase)
VDFVVIIPARHASTRLPGKPLRELAGKPLIQHVYERVRASDANRIIIATDDVRIQRVAESFGAEVCMTSAEHCSGTDRLAEVVDKSTIVTGQIIVNVQGDEPLIPAQSIRQVAESLHFHPEASVATLCTPILSAVELFSPNVVKVAMNNQGYALYFSRAVIPWNRTAFMIQPDELPKHSHYYRHIGLYAYRTDFLKNYVTWPPCYLEQTECLEQLRMLWNGARIHVSCAMEESGPGVDSEDDLAQVAALIAAQDTSRS